LREESIDHLEREPLLDRARRKRIESVRDLTLDGFDLITYNIVIEKKKNNSSALYA